MAGVELPQELWSFGPSGRGMKIEKLVAEAERRRKAPGQ